MSEDYRSMWETLGLDLAAHDALLEVLGKGYQDIYLAQKTVLKAWVILILS